MTISLSEFLAQLAANPVLAVTVALTLGVVLVVTGILMAVSLFWPQLDLRWAIKGAPFILISLGVETLLAARGDQRVRYDWAGMLLCFLVGLGGLALAAAAWYWTHCPWELYGW